MLEIEIFSDVVCPWCFIGKRRLDRVLAEDLGEGVSLRWRPYQLHPNMPVEGVDRGAYLERRYGPDADRSRMPARIAEEAASEGLELRFDRIARMPNTLLAHRLMELAYEHDCQHELAEALFQAYFCDGLDVGDLQTLVSIGQTCGLQKDVVSAYLTGASGLAEVREQLARAVDVGVSGVPGYYLANGFLLPGAQTSETMAQIILRVKNKLSERG
jgi:predicted DsbA family dithiol-disulfide isomerase